MENSIRHEGTIESIAGRHIRVRILQSSACAGCKIASRCTASESKEKIIDVYDDRGRTFNVGDTVMVCTTGKMAGKALLLGFGLPLLLMLAVLCVMLAFGLDEGLAALGAIGSLLPYYMVVWLTRHRIADTIAFSIES